MQASSGKALSVRGAVTLTAVLVGTAALLRQITLHWEFSLLTESASFLRTLIHFGLCIAWAFSLRRRIMQRQVRKTLTIIAGLMLFWLLVRSVKYYYIGEQPGLSRHLWYAYYIPLLLIPLQSLFAALSLGKPEDYKLPKTTLFLYIPTLFFIGLVLTNDLHQFVFTFPTTPWADTDNGYGFGYWLAFGWACACALAALGVILAKSRVPRSAKILWLPFVPFFALVGYAVLNMLRPPFLRIIAGDITVVFCLFIAGIFESCIQIGLIRSNSNYASLFFASDIGARIADNENRVYFATENARPLSPETMALAKAAPLMLDENTRLSAAKIVGGYVFWQEDVSEMNRLLAQLRETSGHLAENNALLQAELDLKERSARIAEKTRLYDKLNTEIAPQLETLSKLLAGENTVKASEKLVWLCVLGSYIKRRSNLTILCEDCQTFSAKELEYCFRESTEALSACGISCFFQRHCEGRLSAEEALFFYDLFEEIVETVLPSLEALFVHLRIDGQTAALKLQFSGFRETFAPEKLRLFPKLTWHGGTFTAATEDATLHLSVVLPLGGAPV